MLSSWMEADVIGSTVLNAFAQGCERVYLVDNDSPDGTVEAALAAGATLAGRFTSDTYDATVEAEKMRLMNRVVEDVSEETPSEHVWWLWIDADEFPHGPRGLTIREFVDGLDRRYRIVGARFLNHLPDRKPEFCHGLHPIDFQPLCEEHPAPMCALSHRKHPLQRWVRGRAPIVCGPGFHKATSAERPLREPTDAILLHHFPYREEQVTRRRLDLLCRPDHDGHIRVRDTGDDTVYAMLPRFATMDAVYRQDWAHVRNYLVPGDSSMGVHPVHWETLVDSESRRVARWYATDQLDVDRRETGSLSLGHLAEERHPLGEPG